MAKPLDFSELATILQTSIKNAPVRAIRMKLTDYCGRCGGSGQYSFNMMHGTTCFGCGGVGHKLLKTARELSDAVSAAKSAVSDGRLAAYLENMRAAKASAKAQDRVMAAWSEAAKLNPYDWRDHKNPEFFEPIRLNKIMHDAYERVSVAANGAKDKPKAEPVELERVMLEALAKIAAVRDILVAKNKKT